VIVACLNGDRPPGSYPAVPTTPQALAVAARDAVEAGAAALHLHPRGADGRESFAAADIIAAVTAVRAACPGVPVGVSTRDGVVPTAVRPRLVRDWPSPRDGGPDMASVNWHEVGAREVAEVLQEREIGVEAGLWHAAAAHAWLADGWPHKTQRVLVEVIPGYATEPGTRGAAAVLAVLPHDGPPLLVHGEEHWAWPVLRWAQARSMAVRIGLEDTLVTEDGAPAPDSATLVRAALHA
jgi:uncharacterized protein (DUF849 family)